MLVSICGLIAAPQAQAGGLSRGGVFYYPAPPRLVYPIYDEVDLKCKESLEFKWINNVFGVRYFEFKLYKGYAMLESTLLLKKVLDYSSDSLKLDSSMFENGQVYTWSLKQIDTAGRKSDRSFNSFKINK